MTVESSRPFAVRIQGDLACFARPELKTERVTYPIATPSAVRGIIEAILWKPAIVWRVDEICVLKPIRYIQFRRNEVNKRIATGAANSHRASGEPFDYFADEDRAQRNTIALRDVDYVVTVRMHMTGRRGPDDSIRKFEEMFTRRLDRGQHVTQPALGCREFPCDVSAWDGECPSTGPDGDLGWMLHDIRFGAQNEAVYFHAVMQNGRVRVPPFPETGDLAR